MDWVFTCRSQWAGEADMGELVLRPVPWHHSHEQGPAQSDWMVVSSSYA